ncbi:MAG: C25 family cysteine peptidase, partial [Bacteroidota bacterium]|nr:C25 family cysteine peptidase [Bacteroidota bacterium]
MKKYLLFAILLCNGLYLSAQSSYISFNNKSFKNYETMPVRAVKDYGTEGLEIEYNFKGAMLTSKKINNVEYQFLHIEGFGKLGDIGRPALPAFNDIIALPENATIEVNIQYSKWIDIDTFMIHPALQPALDTEGASEPIFEIDNQLYSRNALYPAQIVDVIEINQLRNTRLALVRICPVQFNPVSRKLRVFSSIKYKIVFKGSGKSFNQISTNNTFRFTKVLKNLALNNRFIPDGIACSSSLPFVESSYGPRKDYIIITHSAYQSAADTLAKWKRKMGYSVEVVSRSSWSATQVKDSIHSRYSNWTPKPDYFVIIGDHTGSYAVPGETHTSPNNNSFASDLYYACMNGSGDYVPDMARGRISVSSPSQALSVVQKIINYERYPVSDTNFYQNGLNCAQFQDNNTDDYADRRFAHTSEEIRDYIINRGYNVQRIYYASSSVTPKYYNNGYYSNGQSIPSVLLKSNGYSWNGSSSAITTSINAGKFYVFHRDHGYAGGSGWAHPYYTTSSMNSLSNGRKLPVVFSINCHTGEYQLSECFAEKFLRMTNKGAVGVFAASYYSYSGFNDGLSEGFIDAIWSNPGLVPNFGSGGVSNPSLNNHSDIYTMGDVLNQGLIRMVQTWSGSSTYHKYQHELFHYFGEPAMKIWTSTPTSITATHVDTITPSTSSFAISNCSATSAIATLVKGDSLVGKVQLSNGSGSISFSSLANGTNLVLTITEHNKIPYFDTIRVRYLNVIPITQFSASPTTACISSTVSFADQSTSNPTSWTWSFSPSTFSYVNSTSSSSKNPKLQFSASGNYTVTLISSNSSGSDTLTKTNYISVVQINADFSANSTTVCAGSIVDFTDASICSPTSWSWSFTPSTVSFMNSTSATSQNPKVKFNAIGYYSVELIASNTGSSDTIVKNNFINSQALNVDFYANQTNVSSGDTVEFTENSLCSATSYLWSFSPTTISFVGGTNANSQNPKVVFNAEGDYNVKLVASNTYGSDSLLKTQYVTVVNKINMCSVIATTLASGILYDPGGAVNNYNNNQNCGLLINPNCADSISLSFNSFNLETGYDYLKVYDGQNSSGTLLLNASGTIIPSTVVATSGSMYINFISDIYVTRPGFEANWQTVLSIIQADFSINDSTQCKSGNNFVFTNSSTGASTYSWDFGDGNSSTQTSPSHVYANSGSYSVKLISTNSKGCSDSSTKTLAVYPQPTASFSVNDSTQCLSGNSFAFTNSSTGASTYNWNFGDGNSSTQTSPSHVYSNSGSYSVKLISTTANGCSDSVTQNIIVYPQPTASFSVNDSTQCLSGNSFAFTNSSTGASTYNWNFGDGNSSTQTSPSHVYSNSGSYSVKLISTTANGCSDSVTQNIIVYPQPTA